MTRTGNIRSAYALEVKPRPFSRFTSNLLEMKANILWLKLADDWGESKFNNYGFRLRDGEVV